MGSSHNMALYKISVRLLYLLTYLLTHLTRVGVT